MKSEKLTVSALIERGLGKARITPTYHSALLHTWQITLNTNIFAESLPVLELACVSEIAIKLVRNVTLVLLWFLGVCRYLPLKGLLRAVELAGFSKLGMVGEIDRH